MEIKFSKSDLNPWFSKTLLKSLEPRAALIEVPNKFFARWLNEHYAHHIQELFRLHLNIVPEVLFTCASSEMEEQTPSEGDSPEENPHTSQEGPQTFGEFVTGESNRFAYISALEVSRKPASDYNPLYLFSELSVGKTHLLGAIDNEVRRSHPWMNVRYLSAEQFTRQFLHALRKQELPEFRERFSQIDFLLIDDVHLLSGKRKVQTELTSIFNLLLESNKQIVAAAKIPPKEIQDLDDQLRSRLEWGLLAEISAPDQKLKTRIIRRRSRQEKVSVPDDVSFYLANTTSDIGSLVRNVVRLVAHTSLYGQKIDISTVKSVLKSGSSRETGIKKIQKLTAGYFNVSVSDLLSDKRTRRVSYPRQLAMFLCRDFTDLSLKEIGEAFGKKDHSSVIYAVKRIDKDKDKNRDILNDLNRLRNLLA